MADKNSLIDSAQRFLQKGQLDKAIREYYRALELDPKDVRVRHKLGELLARQGTRGEALKELGAVAEAYAKEGFYLKAVAVYKQIIKLKPDLYDVHLKLGGLYQQLSLLSEAMEHYRLVAEFYELNGSSKDCLEVFKKIVDLSPDDVHSKLKLAEYYVREEKADDAIALYQAVAEDLKEKNRTDELIRVYERLVQLTPHSLENLKTLSRMYIEVQEPKRALQKLQICFKADPGDTEVLQMLGDTFVSLDQVPKAKSVFKELARIYEFHGYPDKRREVFERIRRMDPSDTEALQALGLQKELEISPEPVSPSASTSRTAPTPASDPTPMPPPPVVMAVPVAPGSGASSGAARPAARETTASGINGVVAQPVAPVLTQPSAGAGKLREVPASISKLMTEVEVYLKYNLVDKATSHLQLILERAPDSYVAHEKRRELLVAQGKLTEAAQACQQMSMLAAGAGELAQARRDLERAIELDGSNAVYQHALASLSRIVPSAGASATSPAPTAAPPFFQASTSAQVVLIEEDEDAVEEESADDDHFHSLSIGLDESELVEDEGVPSVYLTLNDEELSSELDGLFSSMLEEHDGKASRPDPLAVGAATGDSSPAGGVRPDQAPAEAARVSPAASVVTPPPVEIAEDSGMGGFSDGFDEFELVEDGDGLDLLRELEVEIAAESGQKRSVEPAQSATNPLEVARAYYEMRLYDPAVQLLETLKTQGPLEMEAQWLMGRCLFQKESVGEAVRWYQTVLNRNDLTTTQELEVLFDLGLAYEAQSEYHLALELYEEISSIDDSFREEEVQRRVDRITARASESGGKVRSAR